jgi:calcium-dependent protein kinase
MRQFVKYSRFKQFALRVIIFITKLILSFPHFFFPYSIALWHIQALASTLNEEELADLKDQFDAIDIDKSGSISIEEMRHVSFIRIC